MHEVVDVAERMALRFQRTTRTFDCKLADDVSPDMTSSMHHDLQRGNRLEVGWLSGGVVKLGQEKGVPLR